MSTDTTGLQCAVCHAYLFEDDDVVYCPECGAPHHRSCYHAYGHCGLADLHGTDRQYERPAPKGDEQEQKHTHETQQERSSAVTRCRSCGAEYDAAEARCPHCGMPNVSIPGGYFDLLGGVPADMAIAEDVTASEAGRFIAVNTRRYIPKFAAMTAGKKISWNWLAFLFPSGWLLSRKMYFAGTITGILTIAVSLLSIPFSMALAAVGADTAVGYQSFMQTVIDNMPTIGQTALIAAGIGMLLNLVLRCVVAAAGDYIYRNYTVTSIRSIKKQSDDPDTDFRRCGGINMWAMVLGLFAIQYLPSMIAAFFL